MSRPRSPDSLPAARDDPLRVSRALLTVYRVWGLGFRLREGEILISTDLSVMTVILLLLGIFILRQLLL